MRLIVLLCAASELWAANTYYVSTSRGSDTNTSTQAKSKSTPWAHLPGMASCASNCASYTPVAGDTFVLMGGDTWVNSDLPIFWAWSGTAGSRITITVDRTWYAGASWTRPIFDAQKAPITGKNVVFNAAPYLAGSTSYVTLDSVEMKGLYSADAGSWGNLSYVQCYDACNYWTFNNLYLHGWNVVLDLNCALVLIPGPLGVGTVFTNGIIDGSDATGASPAGGACYAFYHAPDAITNTIIHDLPNAIVGESATGTTMEIGNNLIYNITDSNNGVHRNAIETTGGGTYYIHDNVIHDLATAYCMSLVVGNSNETDYIWNNVIYGLSGCWPPSWPQNNGFTGMAVFAWGNTVVIPGADQCFMSSGYTGAFTSISIQNNHCITTSSTIAPASWSGTPATIDHNVLMTPTVATAAGYTSSQTPYVYFPISGSVATVGAGTNLTTRCSGPLASLCSGTTYACTYSATNKSVTCPAQTFVARPATGAWDIGAYEFSGPQPPTALQATAH